jgi:hypothetical protein
MLPEIVLRQLQGFLSRKSQDWQPRGIEWEGNAQFSRARFDGHAISEVTAVSLPGASSA